jgi:hypothetical protein
MRTAFRRQQWLRERALMLRYTHTACLVNSKSVQLNTLDLNVLLTVHHSTSV